MVPLSKARNINPVSGGASSDSCRIRAKDNKEVLCNPRAESPLRPKPFAATAYSQ